MIDVLSGSFVLPGLVATVVAGALCGAIGVLLGLRGSALAGDAAGHAALPGVCAAWLITGSSDSVVLLAGALISALLAGVTTTWIRALPRMRADAAVAIPLALAFGLGSVLYSVAQRRPGSAMAGLSSFLFGNAAAVDWAQASLVVAVAIVAAVVAVALMRPLQTAIFDPSWAKSAGVPVAVLSALLDVAMAIVVVVAVRGVGVLLVAAMLVIPAAAALQVSRRLSHAMAIAASIGATCGFAGVAVSVSFSGVSTGPAMVLFAAAFFCATALVGRFQRGMLLRQDAR